MGKAHNLLSMEVRQEDATTETCVEKEAAPGHEVTLKVLKKPQGFQAIIVS